MAAFISRTESATKLNVGSGSHAKAAASFARMVHKSALTECWIWRGRRTPLGYGRWQEPGVKDHYAHRLAYEMAHGPVPAGMNVCHRCDNPPCVRVDHLFLATSGDNIRDAARKGRMLHRVTPEIVAAIRKHHAEGEGVAALARRFHVSRGCIRNHIKDTSVHAKHSRKVLALHDGVIDALIDGLARRAA